MRIGQLDDDERRPITAHDSAGASVTPVAKSDHVSVVQIELEPDGVLGMHPATVPQLFVVIAGEGTVRSGGSEPQLVAAGDAVWWDAGEEHETRSDTGLLALVIESTSLDPLY
jgi:quercetin dioxygenase-like cupin family protein